MAEPKRLVLDANILVRACLGVRVRALIADFAHEVDFYVAEANAAEAAGSIGELAHVEASIHRSARRPSSA